MRSNAALLLIRFFALLLILLGTAHFVGMLLLMLSSESMEQVAVRGAEALLEVFMTFGQFLMTPLLVVAAGAVLFVLVEIALRLQQPRDKET